jgi:transposase
MLIIGCDLHTRYQQIAMLDTETGEVVERRLEHANGEARMFYESLPPGARIGIEATIPAQWFERLLRKCGHELWVGDAAQIRAMVVHQQKTDMRDAVHLMKLLATNPFPRIWIPSPEEREVRHLLSHRQKLVWIRTAVKNQLHALAMSQGVCRKSKLWSEQGRKELESLSLGPWAARRRQELLRMLDPLDRSIADLNHAVREEGQKRAEVIRLMTHPGVGPVISLAFVLTVGPVERFRRSKQVVSSFGLNPREQSSGGRQRLGSISKQGNSMMRWLLVEAAQTAARFDPELRRDYLRWKFRRTGGVAKIAIARKLAVRLDWMLRTTCDYAQLVRMQGSPRRNLVETTPSRF